MRFSKPWRYADRDRSKQNALDRRGMTQRGIHRWHGLATILTMMMVRRAPHRFAALHRLFGRRHCTAIQTIWRERNGE
jgi:hypothetical protein